MTNVVDVFPIIKKFNSERGDKIDVEKVPVGEIQEVAFHYTEQLIHHFKNHGFSDDGFFYKDVDFLNEIIESVLMRAAGKHHYMHDLIDDVYEASEKLESEELQSEEKEE